jgi:CAAX prenyl protease-like protein
MAESMKSKPWLPYVAPMGIYMAFLLAQSNANLLWVYPVKIVAVAAALWHFRKEYEELRSPMWCPTVRRRSPDRADSDRPQGLPEDVRGQKTHAQQDKATTAGKMPTLQSWVLSILVGLVAIAIWIGIDPFYHHLGGATPFDPSMIGSVAQRNLFIAFRVIGAVIVVPLMEELLWRAFLIRWLVNEDFKRVPVGMFTWASFGVTVTLFGAEHSEWLAGLICGALYNWLYYKRKDVFSCVVAHAVSNAALAAWVLARGDWKFW